MPDGVWTSAFTRSARPICRTRSSSASARPRRRRAARARGPSRSHVLELGREHPHDLPEVDGLCGDAELARIDAREVEQIGRELGEPLDLLLHRREEPRARLLVELLVREQLEEAADREDRRPQLVRRVGDELLACVVELRELHAHAVEGVGELRRSRRRRDRRSARRSRLPRFARPRSRAAAAGARASPAAVSPRTSASTSAKPVASSRRSRTSSTVASESASGAWKSRTASSPSGTATSA